MGSMIKIRIERYGRHGGSDTPLGNGQTTCRARVPHPAHSLLIEPIFCLGSIWAKLEVTFLASVMKDSISNAVPPLPGPPFASLPRIHTYPTATSSPSHMDRMNLAHLYNARPPDLNPIENRYGSYLCEMKTDPRSPCPIWVRSYEGGDYILVRWIDLAPRLPQRV